MNKWKDETFPLVGWKCVGVKDLGEGIFVGEIPYLQCEMCGHEKIRYVHLMKHPDVKEVLRVGRQCAVKLTGDADKAKRREQDAVSFTRRLHTFMKKR